MATPATGVSGAAASGDAADAPINLLSRPPADAALVPATTATASPALRPSAAPEAQAGLTTPDGTVIADRQADAPKEQYDIALAYMKQKDYDDAERSFSAYAAENPKGRHISDAIYFLGETYYLRGRQREAAEQYLKISAHYPNSPRAPEAMLRLGESLRALGAKEQACATFSEVPRKYPNASAAIKASAQRAAKRAQC
jgi:tol-pal system protein YbgF